LLRVGCVAFGVLETVPPAITDRTPLEGDERFMTERAGDVPDHFGLREKDFFYRGWQVTYESR
jgi:hypothetical protein